ncbi:MAG: hypothetical protein SCI25_00060 [Desulfuromonadales bacterium]|nr:hypothetical protein [Desulfuromonadales bacterium]
MILYVIIALIFGGIIGITLMAALQINRPDNDYIDLIAPHREEKSHDE